MALVVAVAWIGLSAVGPPPVRAAYTATLETSADPACSPDYDPCSKATYRSVGDRMNDFTAAKAPEKLTITDPGVVIAPVNTDSASNCQSNDVGSAECTNIGLLDVLAGGGSDRIGVNGIGGNIYAGNGNDKVDVSGDERTYVFVDGGPGKDTIDVRGPNREDVDVVAGEGHDTVTVRGPSLQRVWVYGEGGNDTINFVVPDTVRVTVSCGKGFDRVFGAPPGSYFHKCEVISG